MKKLLSTTAFVLALAFAASASAHMDRMDWDGKPDGPGFDKAVASLPPKEAGELRDTLRDAREENAGLHDKERQLRQDLHAIMVAPQFDESAYVAKLKELEQLHADMEINTGEAFASVAGELTQQQREKLARAMMHRPPHPPRPPHDPREANSEMERQNHNESSESPPKPPM